MRQRGAVVRQLAGWLADEAGVPVEAAWHGGEGRWVLAWADGPTVTTLRQRALTLIAEVPALGALRRVRWGWVRTPSQRALALAVADAARQAGLPEDPQQLRGMVDDAEVALEERAYPTARDAASVAAADRLVAACGGIPEAMPAALAKQGLAAFGFPETPAPVAAGPDLRGAWVWGMRYEGPVGFVARWPRPPDAQPRDETPACGMCGRPLVVAATGRRPRYCSGACRSRAARRRTADAKPQNKTLGCLVCGTPITVAATGRRPRYCSIACKSRAQRHRATLGPPHDAAGEGR